MRPNFTDWYPPDSRPVRIGFYQRQYYPGLQGLRQDYWNGVYWERGRYISTKQSLPWRGLKEPYHDDR